MEVAALQGHTPDGERFVQPFLDAPIQIASPFPSKGALERTQLEKYRLDYLLRFGGVPFEEVEPGDDPPDFVVRHGGSPHRIDCVALALQERRVAEALFDKLVNKVVANDTASLQHLAGSEIRIWFKSGASDTKLGLPTRANDDAKVGALIEALERFQLDRQRFASIKAEMMAGGPPQKWPDEIAPVEKEGFGFYVEPLDNWQPRDSLAAQLGFNLTLNYSQQLREQDVHEEIQRLVSSHDNGKIDQLLLTIGGPNIYGIRFPAEYYLSTWLREGSIEPVSARHIGQVTAHAWIDGVLFDIPVQTS